MKKEMSGLQRQLNAKDGRLKMTLPDKPRSKNQNQIKMIRFRKKKQRETRLASNRKKSSNRGHLD